MTINKQDGHRACAAGQRSEARLDAACEAAGLKRLLVQKDYKDSIHLYDGTRRLPKPSQFTLAQKKRTNNFFSDGLVVNPLNNKGAIIESKNSDKRGTTEEKVFYTLIKYQSGVYTTHGDRYPFVMLFQGAQCETVNEYRLFKKMARDFNLPIHVIIDSTPELTKFQSLMKKLLG